MLTNNGTIVGGIAHTTGAPGGVANFVTITTLTNNGTIIGRPVQYDAGVLNEEERSDRSLMRRTQRSPADAAADAA